MAAAVNPEELFQALQAALHSDASMRSRAEAFLQQAYAQRGCAMALLQIAAATSDSVELGVSLAHLLA